MTNITRRIEIQIETHDVTILRTRGHKFSVYCERCKQDVSTFTPEQISTWLRLIEAGDVSSMERIKTQAYAAVQFKLNEQSARKPVADQIKET